MLGQITWTVDEPPFSFRYNGRSSREFLGQWQGKETVESTATGRLRRFEYCDPATRLRVRAEVKELADPSAVEWVLTFANEGGQDTPILEDILPLDAAWTGLGNQPLRLHRAKGSSCQIDDFLPITEPVLPGRRIALAPVGGRSSNGVLPFMNLQCPAGGLALAIGWSGQWSAAFDRAQDALRATAGMEKTHLLLRPGERIRTPRILIVPWQGQDAQTGQNALRRVLMAHYLPRLDGELILPPLAVCMQGWYYRTNQAGEQIELAAQARSVQAGADTYWIDACWYGQGRPWWQEVGNWTIRREVFPNGLKPIADAAHRAGQRFLLWFEPERVQRGTELDAKHPEYLLRSPHDANNFLLNLGLPAARRHVTEAVAGIIAQTGVDIYRQDFNFDPLPYWQAADAPDRVGMTEIRHVEGLYEMWDELRRRFPRLAIDNCASGGRRIDLETMSRSLPLWRTDFLDTVGLPTGQNIHVGAQCSGAGLSRWVPLHGGGVWVFSPYGTRSLASAGFTFACHLKDEHLPGEMDPPRSSNDMLGLLDFICSDAFPMDAARAALAEQRSLQPFFAGDFYLLTALTAAEHDWCAFQHHRPDLGAGFAVFLRRHRSPFTTMSAGLRELDGRGRYEVSLSPTYQVGPSRTITGRRLAGMTINIPSAPGSVLLRYKKIK